MSTRDKEAEAKFKEVNEAYSAYESEKGPGMIDSDTGIDASGFGGSGISISAVLAIF